MRIYAWVSLSEKYSVSYMDYIKNNPLEELI